MTEADYLKRIADLEREINEALMLTESCSTLKEMASLCIDGAALAVENRRLREACEGAIEWLEGWASAEPYLGILRAAIRAGK